MSASVASPADYLRRMPRSPSLDMLRKARVQQKAANQHQGHAGGNEVYAAAPGKLYSEGSDETAGLRTTRSRRAVLPRNAAWQPTPHKKSALAQQVSDMIIAMSHISGIRSCLKRFFIALEQSDVNAASDAYVKSMEDLTKSHNLFWNRFCSMLAAILEAEKAFIALLFPGDKKATMALLTKFKHCRRETGFYLDAQVVVWSENANYTPAKLGNFGAGDAGGAPKRKQSYPKETPWRQKSDNADLSNANRVLAPSDSEGDNSDDDEYDIQNAFSSLTYEERMRIKSEPTRSALDDFVSILSGIGGFLNTRITTLENYDQLVTDTIHSSLAELLPDRKYDFSHAKQGSLMEASKVHPILRVICEHAEVELQTVISLRQTQYFVSSFQLERSLLALRTAQSHIDMLTTTLNDTQPRRGAPSIVGPFLRNGRQAKSKQRSMQRFSALLFARKAFNTLMTKFSLYFSAVLNPGPIQITLSDGTESVKARAVHMVQQFLDIQTRDAHLRRSRLGRISSPSTSRNASPSLSPAVAVPSTGASGGGCSGDIATTAPFGSASGKSNIVNIVFLLNANDCAEQRGHSGPFRTPIDPQDPRFGRSKPISPRAQREGNTANVPTPKGSKPAVAEQKGRTLPVAGANGYWPAAMDLLPVGKPLSLNFESTLELESSQNLERDEEGKLQPARKTKGEKIARSISSSSNSISMDQISDPSTRPLTGVGSWPVIARFPATFEESKYMADIVSLLVDSSLNISKVPYVFPEKSGPCRYVLYQVDVAVVMVLIYLNESFETTTQKDVAAFCAALKKQLQIESPQDAR